MWSYGTEGIMAVMVQPECRVLARCRGPHGSLLVLAATASMADLIASLRARVTMAERASGDAVAVRSRLGEGDGGRKRETGRDAGEAIVMRGERGMADGVGAYASAGCHHRRLRRSGS